MKPTGSKSIYEHELVTYTSRYAPIAYVLAELISVKKTLEESNQIISGRNGDRTVNFAIPLIFDGGS